MLTQSFIVMREKLEDDGMLVTYYAHTSPEAKFIMKAYINPRFSSSNPYQTLPQKLCLTFRAPNEKDANAICLNTDEVAKEFAAFLSLVTRCRVFAGKHTRYNGLPIEYEIELYPRLTAQERQSQRGTTRL